VRWVPIIEGTADGGVSWRPYAYRFMTSHRASAPRFVAPHHPRWAHAVFYESVRALRRRRG
jgi:hypothetical protein